MVGNGSKSLTNLQETDESDEEMEAVMGLPEKHLPQLRNAGRLGSNQIHQVEKNNLE